MPPFRAPLLVCIALVGFAAACGGNADGDATRVAGRLDPSFGTRGVVTTDFGHYAFLEAIDEAPDGRIVAVGTTLKPNSVQSLGLVRYRADGRLDATFGFKGVVETRVARETVAVAVDARADGSTVVLAWTREGFEPAHLTLARYDDRGRLDPGFGVGGIVVTGAPDLAFDPSGFLPTTDDTIMVGGSYSVLQRGGIFVARYLADGRLDPSFGTGGTAMVDTGYNTGFDASLARRADGGLTSATLAFADAQPQLLFLHFTPDGAVDTSFGEEGRVLVDHDQLFQLVGSLPDGSVLTAIGEADGTRLQRYRPDATFDAAFASPSIPGWPGAMTTDAAGNVILTLTRFESEVIVARVLPSGALDPAFGDGGTVTLPTPGSMHAVIVPRAGGILTGGWLREPNFRHLEFALLRYDG